VEQQRDAGLAERQVAQFVEDNHVHSQQAVCDAPGATRSARPSKGAEYSVGANRLFYSAL
jgi:hypothetical protein